MLKARTYETITAGLRKMIEDLTKYTTEQDERAKGFRYTAEQSLRAADSADAEAAKAQATASKLAGLLS